MALGQAPEETTRRPQCGTPHLSEGTPTTASSCQHLTNPTHILFPPGPILLLPQMLRQVPIHMEPSGLSLWPRPWSGDTKCDWMLGRVP